MAIADRLYRRLFAVTMYKNKRLHLAEMSFSKDFVRDRRGDMYPVLEKCGEFEETTGDGKYLFRGDGARIRRLIGGHFPYASYEMEVDSLPGSCGFAFLAPRGSFAVRFFVREGRLFCKGEADIKPLGADLPPISGLNDSQTYLLPGDEADTGFDFAPGMRLIVTARREYFDLYADTGAGPVHFASYRADEFADMDRQAVFERTKAVLEVGGGAQIGAVKMYMDCGVSQADIRPIRYENGEIMLENGRVYLTMSVRMHAQGYQGIFAWIPGTDEFELTGALFFDTGDGRWCADVASSILYHRGRREWLVWMCAFSHGHVLAHGVSRGDVRFGVNVVDVELMRPMPQGADDTLFLGKPGDEDPDLLFDEKSGKWLLTVCRPLGWEKEKPYRYFLFASDDPFDGYRFIAHSLSGSETGGSIVPDEDGYCFICGSGFDRRAEYHAYRLPDMTKYELLHCDHDDGGFRGWGTVMPIWCGSRRRIFWLTFDRHKGSDFNWSYGNIYCFEAIGK